ncbi:MAG: hypothetical protein K0U23_03025 [Gammaproteobacteria bacterium]|nr:hypothetical protein [Gammaproteobacteria bacterium]
MSRDTYRELIEQIQFKPGVSDAHNQKVALRRRAEAVVHDTATWRDIEAQRAYRDAEAALQQTDSLQLAAAAPDVHHAIGVSREITQANQLTQVAARLANAAKSPATHEMELMQQHRLGEKWRAPGRVTLSPSDAYIAYALYATSVARMHYHQDFQDAVADYTKRVEAYKANTQKKELGYSSVDSRFGMTDGDLGDAQKSVLGTREFQELPDAPGVSLMYKEPMPKQVGEITERERRRQAAFAKMAEWAKQLVGGRTGAQLQNLMVDAQGLPDKTSYSCVLNLRVAAEQFYKKGEAAQQTLRTFAEQFNPGLKGSTDWYKGLQDQFDAMIAQYQDAQRLQYFKTNPVDLDFIREEFERHRAESSATPGDADMAFLEGYRLRYKRLSSKTGPEADVACAQYYCALQVFLGRGTRFVKPTDVGFPMDDGQKQNLEARIAVVMGKSADVKSGKISGFVKTPDVQQVLLGWVKDQMKVYARKFKPVDRTYPDLLSMPEVIRAHAEWQARMSSSIWFDCQSAALHDYVQRALQYANTGGRNAVAIVRYRLAVLQQQLGYIPRVFDAVAAKYKPQRCAGLTEEASDVRSRVEADAHSRLGANTDTEVGARDELLGYLGRLRMFAGMHGEQGGYASETMSALSIRAALLLPLYRSIKAQQADMEEASVVPVLNKLEAELSQVSAAMARNLVSVLREQRKDALSYTKSTSNPYGVILQQGPGSVIYHEPLKSNEAVRHQHNMGIDLPSMETDFAKLRTNVLATLGVSEKSITGGVLSDVAVSPPDEVRRTVLSEEDTKKTHLGHMIETLIQFPISLTDLTGRELASFRKRFNIELGFVQGAPRVALHYCDVEYLYDGTVRRRGFFVPWQADMSNQVTDDPQGVRDLRQKLQGRLQNYGSECLHQYEEFSSRHMAELLRASFYVVDVTRTHTAMMAIPDVDQYRVADVLVEDDWEATDAVHWNGGVAKRDITRVIKLKEALDSIQLEIDQVLRAGHNPLLEELNTLIATRYDTVRGQIQQMARAYERVLRNEYQACLDAKTIIDAKRYNYVLSRLYYLDKRMHADYVTGEQFSILKYFRHILQERQHLVNDNALPAITGTHRLKAGFLDDLQQSCQGISSLKPEEAEAIQLLTSLASGDLAVYATFNAGDTVSQDKFLTWISNGKTIKAAFGGLAGVSAKQKQSPYYKLACAIDLIFPHKDEFKTTFVTNVLQDVIPGDSPLLTLLKLEGRKQAKEAEYRVFLLGVLQRLNGIVFDTRRGPGDLSPLAGSGFVVGQFILSDYQQCINALRWMQELHGSEYQGLLHEGACQQQLQLLAQNFSAYIRAHQNDDGMYDHMLELINTMCETMRKIEVENNIQFEDVVTHVTGIIAGLDFANITLANPSLKLFLTVAKPEQKQQFIQRYLTRALNEMPGLNPDGADDPTADFVAIVRALLQSLGNEHDKAFVSRWVEQNRPKVSLSAGTSKRDVPDTSNDEAKTRICDAVAFILQNHQRASFTADYLQWDAANREANKTWNIIETAITTGEAFNARAINDAAYDAVDKDQYDVKLRDRMQERPTVWLGCETQVGAIVGEQALIKRHEKWIKSICLHPQVTYKGAVRATCDTFNRALAGDLRVDAEIRLDARVSSLGDLQRIFGWIERTDITPPQAGFTREALYAFAMLKQQVQTCAKRGDWGGRENLLKLAKKILSNSNQGILFREINQLPQEQQDIVRRKLLIDNEFLDACEAAQNYNTRDVAADVAQLQTFVNTAGRKGRFSALAGLVVKRDLLAYRDLKEKDHDLNQYARSISTAGAVRKKEARTRAWFKQARTKKQNELERLDVITTQLRDFQRDRNGEIDKVYGKTIGLAQTYYGLHGTNSGGENIAITDAEKAALPAEIMKAEHEVQMFLSMVSTYERRIFQQITRSRDVNGIDMATHLLAQLRQIRMSDDGRITLDTLATAWRDNPLVGKRLSGVAKELQSVERLINKARILMTSNPDQPLTLSQRVGQLLDDLKGYESGGLLIEEEVVAYLLVEDSARIEDFITEIERVLSLGNAIPARLKKALQSLREMLVDAKESPDYEGALCLAAAHDQLNSVREYHDEVFAPADQAERAVRNFLVPAVVRGNTDRSGLEANVKGLHADVPSAAANETYRLHVVQESSDVLTADINAAFNRMKQALTVDLATEDSLQACLFKFEKEQVRVDLRQSEQALEGRFDKTVTAAQERLVSPEGEKIREIIDKAPGVAMTPIDSAILRALLDDPRLDQVGIKDRLKDRYPLSDRMIEELYQQLQDQHDRVRELESYTTPEQLRSLVEATVKEGMVQAAPVITAVMNKLRQDSVSLKHLSLDTAGLLLFDKRFMFVKEAAKFFVDQRARFDCDIKVVEDQCENIKIISCMRDILGTDEAEEADVRDSLIVLSTMKPREILHFYLRDEAATLLSEQQAIAEKIQKMSQPQAGGPPEDKRQLEQLRQRLEEVGVKHARAIRLSKTVPVAVGADHPDAVYRELNTDASLALLQLRWLLNGSIATEAAIKATAVHLQDQVRDGFLPHADANTEIRRIIRPEITGAAKDAWGLASKEELEYMAKHLQGLKDAKPEMQEALSCCESALRSQRFVEWIEAIVDAVSDDNLHNLVSLLSEPPSMVGGHLSVPKKVWDQILIGRWGMSALEAIEKPNTNIKINRASRDEVKTRIEGIVAGFNAHAVADEPVADVAAPAPFEPAVTAFAANLVVAVQTNYMAGFVVQIEAQIDAINKAYVKRQSANGVFAKTLDDPSYAAEIDKHVFDDLNAGRKLGFDDWFTHTTLSKLISSDPDALFKVMLPGRSTDQSRRMKLMLSIYLQAMLRILHQKAQAYDAAAAVGPVDAAAIAAADISGGEDGERQADKARIIRIREKIGEAGQKLFDAVIDMERAIEQANTFMQTHQDRESDGLYGSYHRTAIHPLYDKFMPQLMQFKQHCYAKGVDVDADVPGVMTTDDEDSVLNDSLFSDASSMSSRPVSQFSSVAGTPPATPPRPRAVGPAASSTPRRDSLSSVGFFASPSPLRRSGQPEPLGRSVARFPRGMDKFWSHNQAMVKRRSGGWSAAVFGGCRRSVSPTAAGMAAAAAAPAAVVAGAGEGRRFVPGHSRAL